MDLGDDVGDAREDVVGAEDGAGALDGLGQPPAVAGRLADRVRDERGGLRHVESQAARLAGAGQFGGREEQQPVAFRGGQSHPVFLL